MLGAAMFPSYQAVRLVIPSKAQLTAAGVQRASLREAAVASAQMSGSLHEGDRDRRRRCTSSAATFYVGLAQWEYGDFVKNVQLPADLTDVERAVGDGRIGATGRAVLRRGAQDVAGAPRQGTAGEDRQ